MGKAREMGWGDNICNGAESGAMYGQAHMAHIDDPTPALSSCPNFPTYLIWLNLNYVLPRMTRSPLTQSINVLYMYKVKTTQPNPTPSPSGLPHPDRGEKPFSAFETPGGSFYSAFPFISRSCFRGNMYMYVHTIQYNTTRRMAGIVCNGMDFVHTYIVGGTWRHTTSAGDFRCLPH